MTWEGSVEKEFWNRYTEYLQMQLDYVGEKAKRLGIDFNPDLSVKEDLGKALDNLADIVERECEDFFDEDWEREQGEKKQKLREKIENCEDEDRRKWLMMIFGDTAYRENDHE
jgi:thiamine pyrophosphate-dependent acetolactate synthase large subunit-like protein